MSAQVSPSKLSSFVDSLQAQGYYTFQRREALQALGISPAAFQSSARRLAQKGRIATPRRGFYLIVPLEYRTAGSPPPSWFIDDLMAFHGQPYYVGLLSAAALHGAAHQAPQEFQVLTSAPLRPIRIGRLRIRFFVKKHLELTRVQQMQTHTGSMRVSTPESTALDLVRYFKSAGYLSHVATVLSELAEVIDAARLVRAAKIEPSLPPIQRLGHLLERFGFARHVAPLAEWIHGSSPRTIPLRPDRPTETAQKDYRWLVLVNDHVEPDEL